MDNKLRQTPFLNDPFSVVYQAFNNLWPEMQCEIWWIPETPSDEKGRIAYGETYFHNDGTAHVYIPCDTGVLRAVEILAHELAHVAVGDAEDHGEVWKVAFSAIMEEFKMILEKEKQMEENVHRPETERTCYGCDMAEKHASAVSFSIRCTACDKWVHSPFDHCPEFCPLRNEMRNCS